MEVLRSPWSWSRPELPQGPGALSTPFPVSVLSFHIWQQSKYVPFSLGGLAIHTFIIFFLFGHTAACVI